MKLFLPEEVWKNKRGFDYGKPVNYLAIGFHAGQDFFSQPIGSIPVIAPCDGHLTTYPFSKSAGWWGFFRFEHQEQVYSLKILHMYKEMKTGEYKEGDILGYCGATGLSVTSKYGDSYIGPSDEEQNSDRAVAHLHAELHIGEFQHDTNRVRILAEKRIVDPVRTFEKWVTENPATSNAMVFYNERGKSSVYLRGVDNIFYPVIIDRHFLTLFGDWKLNTIKEVDSISPKSDSYFGLFKAGNDGRYDVAIL